MIQRISGEKVLEYLSKEFFSHLNESVGFDSRGSKFGFLNRMKKNLARWLGKE